MNLQQIINKFLLFTLSSIYTILECNIFRPEDQEEDIKRLMQDLEMKKHEFSDKDGELQIYYVVINVLIGTICFFLFIILSCAIYEIINCCMERKKELERQKLYIKNKQTNNSKNFNLKLSNGSSSSDDDKKVAKVENSFHSSHMSASIKSKADYNYNSNNNDMQKSNINDPNYLRPRENSGYEAPIIQNVVEKKNNNINNNNKDEYNNIDNDNKEQKLLTNDGNEGNEENVNLKNPFQN